MSDLGKVDAAFFADVLYPNLGAGRADVALGPQPGVDFGVLRVGADALVAATDPLSVLAPLGLERGAELALDIVLTDVAVSGIAPSHCAIALTLPPEMPDADAAAIWRGFDAHARALGVSIVDAHVGRYPGVESSWIGGATGFGLGDPADLIRPNGARPGDAVVISTGPGAEVAGLASHLYPEALGVSDADLAAAQDRLADVRGVEDALAAAGAGDVSAMHDATEGGIVGGLTEMADGAGVRIDLDSAAVPVADGVEAVCGALGVDPWHVTSCGTLLVTVDPDDAEGVVSALENRGTPAAVVGSVNEGSGLYVDGERRRAPERDPSWAAMAALAERTE
ncbi:MAG: AIR synthase-related protein [Haloarculaceae archaeon]